MDEAFAADDASVRTLRIRPIWRSRYKLGVGGRRVAQRYRVKAFTVIGPKNAKPGVAQSCRLFEHRVEHRREIAGRGVDDLKDLGRRGLACACGGQLYLKGLDTSLRLRG